MNEAQRFLRYIMPGVLFGFLTLFLVWIVLPEWTSSILKEQVFAKGSSVAIIIGSVFASGAIGYLFATIHHWCHWHSPFDRNVIDHTVQAASLREKGLIPPLADPPADFRIEALTTISVLWFERLGEGNQVANSEDRVAAFGDLSHGAGTARVASAFALLVAVLVCTHYGRWDPSLSNMWHYIVMVILGCLTIWLFHDAYRRTGRISQQLYDQILEHALLEEKKRDEQNENATMPLNEAARSSEGS